MMSISSGRWILFGVQLWRGYQQKITPPNTQLLRYSQFSPVGAPHRATSSRPACSARLLSIRLGSFQAPCLIHTDSQDTSRRKYFSMKALSQAPRPALYLGFSGLIPFLSAPLLMAATQTFYPEVAYAQVLYGASIVSFLGGARWGFAIPTGSPAKPDWMNLGNSVVPSLLAWLALLCRDNITEGALVVIMGLGLSLHYDLTLLPGYPNWFRAMRTVLTLVATFSLVATLALKRVCSEKKLKH